MTKKLERKKGIYYVKCQHLKEKTQEAEAAAWWIGETTRVIVCPICEKMHAGNMLNFVYAMFFEINEYERRKAKEKIDAAKEDGKP